MFTASRVRDHIEYLHDDEIFTTRDLLYCGGRNAVDLTLSKMVRTKQIMRIARGVFVKFVESISSISLYDIAVAKAKGFGNHIYRYGRSAALQMGIIKTFHGKDNEYLFYTSGCSTSFKCENNTIRLVAACSRKRLLPESQPGELLKAVWHFGWPNFSILRLRARYIFATLSHEEKFELRSMVRKLPPWVINIFLPAEGSPPEIPPIQL